MLIVFMNIAHTDAEGDGARGRGIGGGRRGREGWRGKRREGRDDSG